MSKPRNHLAVALQKRHGGGVRKHKAKKLNLRKGSSRKIKHKNKRGW